MEWLVPVRAVALAAICCASLPARPATGHSADVLKACLAAFDGIAWRFPYRPFTRVYRCSWPGGGYNDQANPQQGRSRLELIASGAMPRNSRQSVGMPDYQDAVFTHFDGVFTRHGFQRVETRQAEQGADRYVEFARYLKRGDSGPILTWQAGGANTWLVTLEASAK